MSSNPHADYNRGLKIAAIIKLIDDGETPDDMPRFADPYGDAADVARWLRGLDDKGWHRLALAADYPSKTPPRETTRGLVIQAFELRASQAAHLDEVG